MLPSKCHGVGPGAGFSRTTPACFAPSKNFSTASSVPCETLCRPDRRDQPWTSSRRRRTFGLLESSPALVKDVGDSLIAPLRDQPLVGSFSWEPRPANMLVKLAALRDPKAVGRMRAAGFLGTWCHVSDDIDELAHRTERAKTRAGIGSNQGQNIDPSWFPEGPEFSVPIGAAWSQGTSCPGLCMRPMGWLGCYFGAAGAGIYQVINSTAR